MKEIISTSVFSSYEDYLNSGGLFTNADYGVIDGTVNPSDDKKSLLQINAEIGQITHIAAFCGIQVSEQQKHIYVVLGCKFPPLGAKQKPEDPRAVSICQMSDQELVRQIILATEGKGEKYQIITNTYPNIFENKLN